MIEAHPMVKGSFASKSVRVQKQDHYNAGFAASEAVIDRKHATIGCAELAIALHRALIAKSPDEPHLECIAIHEATIKRVKGEVA